MFNVKMLVLLYQIVRFPVTLNNFNYLKPLVKVSHLCWVNVWLASLVVWSMCRVDEDWRLSYGMIWLISPLQVNLATSYTEYIADRHIFSSHFYGDGARLYVMCQCLHHLTASTAGWRPVGLSWQNQFSLVFNHRSNTGSHPDTGVAQRYDHQRTCRTSVGFDDDAPREPEQNTDRTAAFITLSTHTAAAVALVNTRLDYYYL